MTGLTKRAQQALETKHAIFTCALELFAHEPYEQITVKDICDAAGVSIGAFYHHFGSKGDLLDEGYRLFDEQIEQIWTTRATAGPIDDIHLLVRHQMESMEQMGDFAAAQYFKNQLSVEHDYMLDSHRAFSVHLEESLRACVDMGVLTGSPAQIVEEILCVARGTIYDWCLHAGSYRLAERALSLVDMVLEHYAA